MRPDNTSTAHGDLFNFAIESETFVVESEPNIVLGYTALPGRRAWQPEATRHTALLRSLATDDTDRGSGDVGRSAATPAIRGTSAQALLRKAVKR